MCIEVILPVGCGVVMQCVGLCSLVPSVDGNACFYGQDWPFRFAFWTKSLTPETCYIVVGYSNTVRNSYKKKGERASWELEIADYSSGTLP